MANAPIPDNDTLTAVPGLRVGHAQVPGGRTGCTVILGPFRGRVERLGGAPGSRELATLEPDHLVERVDALLLTGGSAFGLAAADGVMAWLEERGLGFPTPSGPVPIVPAAVIYDLVRGGSRPGPLEGRAACDAASSEPVAQGRVGAGCGASVGRLAPGGERHPGGVGSAARRLGRHMVGALAVVNAVGDVVDGRGRILAGARSPDGSWRDSTAEVLGQASGGDPLPGARGATTLAVVATDAPLSRVDLGRVARMASAGLARRITPALTPWDGDLLFALSTAPEATGLVPAEVAALGVAAAEVLERAIERSVR